MSEPTKLSAMTAEIEAIEREQAPGSETALWAKFCEWCRTEYGVLPYGDYDGDYFVQTVDRQWWLDEYATQERA